MLRGANSARFRWALRAAVVVVACYSNIVDSRGQQSLSAATRGASTLGSVALDLAQTGRTPALAAPVRRPQHEHQQGRESKSNNNGDANDDLGYLESMEDLEHVTYLAMRNFNITDEGLLAQSSRLMNLGNAANHKQHQAAAIGDQKTRLALMLESFILHLRNGHLRRLHLEELEAIVATLNSTAASSSSQRAASSDAEQPLNSREPVDGGGDSFVESGRQQIQSTLDSSGALGAGSPRSEGGDGNAIAAGSEATSAQRESAFEQMADKSSDRCQFLVTIYKLELKERRNNFEQQQRQQQQQQQQSKIEYENAQQQVDSQPSQSQARRAQFQQSQQQHGRRTRRSSAREPVQPSGESRQASKQVAAFVDSANSGQELNEVDSKSSGGGGGYDENNRGDGGGPDSVRLMRLCQLAVKCHSADELVNLIGGPWRPPASANFAGGGGGGSDVASNDRTRRMKRWLASTPMAAATAEKAEAVAASGDNGVAGLGLIRQPDSSASSDQETGKAEQTRPRNLRDSLSLSLAKLCPLMLFQLHDDDGLCSVRRDDRPSMITVWGFATLFVTIVSFCSLIGLSITPLLGPTVADSSTIGSSDTDDSSPAAESRRFHHGQPHGHHHHHHRQHHHLRQAASAAAMATLSDGGSGGNGDGKGRDHRTCLTLFEGLAVGSLVGSALFSLIPQAFELQERESNQGFLLKALIIFFGIYLFFCSERIMRIILDTRQQRKRKKRITNHRSSNSMALPSTMVDYDHHHHHPNHPHQHYHHHNHPNTSLALQQQQASSRLANGGRKNLATNQLSFRFSGGGGGGGGGSTSKLNLRDQHSKAIGSGRAVHTPAAAAIVSTRPNQSGVKSPASCHHQHPHQQQQPLAKIASSELKSLGSATGGAGATTAPTPASSTRNRTRRRKTRHQLQATKRHQRKRHNQPLVLNHHHHHHHHHHPSHQLPPLQRNSSDDVDLHGSLASAVASSSSSSLSLVFVQDRHLPPSAKNSHRRPDQDDSLAGESCAYMSASNDEINFSDDDDKYQQMRAVNKHLFSGRRLNQEAECLSFLQQQQQKKQRTSFYIGGHSDPEDAVNQEYQYQQQRQYQLQHQQTQMTDTNANHVSNNKQDISTVAWMIVLGDGLHNFIDGISIGAAFSESILSGVSISVAVICEEFPHELGDFAVLVSSGMTVRQALGYNFLSACTCYFGMAVGIILGDFNDGASYISALAAGVFLYIALVDMMGELSATLEETSRDSIAKTLKMLLLQNIGIFIGISIIFILSFIDF